MSDGAERVFFNPAMVVHAWKEMAHVWYIGNRSSGSSPSTPIEERQLISLIREGKITSSTPVSSPTRTQGKWIRAKQIRGFERMQSEGTELRKEKILQEIQKEKRQEESRKDRASSAKLRRRIRDFQDEIYREVVSEQKKNQTKDRRKQGSRVNVMTTLAGSTVFAFVLLGILLIYGFPGNPLTSFLDGNGSLQKILEECKEFSAEASVYYEAGMMRENIVLDLATTPKSNDEFSAANLLLEFGAKCRSLKYQRCYLANSGEKLLYIEKKDLDSVSKSFRSGGATFALKNLPKYIKNLSGESPFNIRSRGSLATMEKKQLNELSKLLKIWTGRF